jgi:general nucleoside transport system permease protein
MTGATATIDQRFRVGRGALVAGGIVLVLAVVILATGGGPAVIDFLGWFIEFALANPSIILGFAVPIGYGALCAVMNERSGVVNIGVEGMLLTSAFVGFLTGAYLNPVVGHVPAALLGVVTAIIASMVLSALHAWLSITVKADQIISGTVINILALGGTAYFNQLLISTAGVTGAQTLPRNVLSIPADVFTIPVAGPVLRAVVGGGPIQTSLIVAVVVLQLLLFRSRWGLRTRAVGEHPKAADTVGIDVYRVRYRNVILGGVFAGLGGAYLTLESVGSFQDGMTGGVGFIAIAAMIFGRWTPVGALGAALIFGAARALQTAVQRDPPPGAVGDFLATLPGSGEIYGMLPYILTIVVLVGVVGRAVAPAADGIPYDKEARA